MSILFYLFIDAMVVMEEVCICRPWHSDASGLYLSAMTMVVMQEVYLSVAIHVVFLSAMSNYSNYTSGLFIGHDT
jgi:hypothetical protein